MAAIASVTSSSDPYVSGLLGSYKWASGSLTYSFPTSYTQFEGSYGSGEPLNNFEALNATQQDVARAAFANFAAVANLTFTELTGADAANATLRLAESDAPSTAWAYMPHTAPEGGDTWFNNSNGWYDNPRQGNYAYTTFLHEMGHTLGLEHPHENGMPADGDSMEYSVMSYRAYVGAPLTGYPNETWGFAQSLMMYDIAAVQHLYGANFTTNSGNTSYSWSPTTGQMSINGVGQATPGGNRIFQTVWDGGGTDTYNFSNYTTDLRVDLRPGEWTTTSSAQLARLHWDGSEIAEGNIANALQYKGDVRSLIENAIGGSGNDTIIGNEANNWFRGNGGSDVMDGGAGRDTAAFSGFFRQYTVNGNLTERSISSATDGNEILRSIESSTFVDGTLISDVSSSAAVVYRMYDAAFDRAPDALGLNTWISSVQNGLSAAALAGKFLKSQEFISKYGGLDNSDFVWQLYHFVLDRDPDAAGHQKWTDALNSASLTRADVLAGFSESPEHKELLRPVIENGIWDINENAAAAARLYHAALDRAPDAGGLLTWKTALDTGTSLKAIAGAFVASNEFQSRYGALSNSDFVEQLYINALDRLPDAVGHAKWTDALDNGLARGSVVTGFSESFEHQSKTLAVIDQGIFVV